MTEAQADRVRCQARWWRGQQCTYLSGHSEGHCVRDEGGECRWGGGPGDLDGARVAPMMAADKSAYRARVLRETGIDLTVSSALQARLTALDHGR